MNNNADDSNENSSVNTPKFNSLPSSNPGTPM